MSIGQRIRTLRESLQMTQQGLADLLGLTRASISSIERSKSDLTVPHLIELVRFFGVSADALLFGTTGPERPPKQATTGNTTDFMPIIVDRSNQPVIKLLNQAAQAGYLQEKHDPQYWDDQPEVALPDPKYRQGHYMGLQVWGESMQNTLNGGDWIICQCLPSLDYLQFGEIYVVVCQNRAPVVKRVEAGPTPTQYLLVSDNSQHPPYPVEQSEVLELWRYDTLLRTQPFTLKK